MCFGVNRNSKIVNLREFRASDVGACGTDIAVKHDVVSRRERFQPRSRFLIHSLAQNFSLSHRYFSIKDCSQTNRHKLDF